MRKLKFRAWDKKEKEWIDLNEFMITGNGKLAIDDYSTGDFIEQVEVDRFIIVQWIGLKDKNGKDIYEGDILRGIVEDVILFGAVEFDEDLPSYVVDGGQTFFQLSKTIIDEGIEIIGNIYENPELLKN